MKKFNIHEWQDKQKRLSEQEDTDLLSFQYNF